MVTNNVTVYQFEVGLDEVFADEVRFCVNVDCVIVSEGCSLHAVALLDSIWIDKLHRLSLPTGKWVQLPFFGPASHWNPIQPSSCLSVIPYELLLPWGSISPPQQFNPVFSRVPYFSAP